MLGPLLIALLGAARAAPDSMPAPAERTVPRTHAHNDYEHAHPLFDALHEGFASVEAAVYLVGKELRVSHEAAKDWARVPTLEDAYLTPLARLKAAHDNGGVYADGSRVLLLIDVKTDAAPTYARLDEVLAAYEAKTPGLFSRWEKLPRGESVTRGAIDVVITGNRSRGEMLRRDRRYAGYDGRMEDVGKGDAGDERSRHFMPLISDDWKKVFTGESAWDGTGPVPAATRARMDALVAQVHREGRMLRFWNLPKDAPAVWGVLFDAGVDLINTDDLPGLAKYVRSRQAAGEPTNSPTSK